MTRGGGAATATAARIRASRLSPVRRWRLHAALVMLGVVGSPVFAHAACTPSPLPADTPLALIFSGGGAKGAYEAGVAAVFMRRGLPIRLAAGSSAGALNAAMVAD